MSMELLVILAAGSVHHEQRGPAECCEGVSVDGG